MDYSVEWVAGRGNWQTSGALVTIYGDQGKVRCQNDVQVSDDDTMTDRRVQAR